jgi:cell division septum initiation protein DivIVA
MNVENLPDLAISDEELTVQELRDHYQKIVDEYGKVVDNARAQLERIEAFLQDLSGLKISPAPSQNSSAATTAAKTAASQPKTGKAKGGPGRKPKAATVAKVKGTRGRKKVSLKLQSDYQKLTLLGAIAKVLEAREGKIVTADEVVKALYGELKPSDHKVAKDRVTKNLSKGKTEGKWARLPDQLGAYTWNLDTVKEG